MPPAPHWDLTPRQSVERECARRGEHEVVARCVALLRGGDTDLEFARVIGGPAADSVLGPHLRSDQRYFLRTWAARALLYAWDAAAAGAAVAAVVAALADEAWRVREMAAKVVARRQLGEALSAVAALQQDPVPRVRAAATRALAVLTVTGA
jgi:hypothetical protein